MIGVVVEGSARAYRLNAYSSNGWPGDHIVNDTINSVPITVARCDHEECVRVFAGEHHRHPLDVRAGGRTGSGELVLLLDGQRYAISSNDIPLTNYSFEETTWKNWLEKHPDSTVYVGQLH